MGDELRMTRGMDGTGGEIMGARGEAGELLLTARAPAEVVLDGARIAALHDLGLLDTGAEEEFDRYTRLATDLLGVSVSLVSLALIRR